MKRILFLVVMCHFNLSFSQGLDTLKVVSYNLLNFPSVSPDRVDTLKEIMSYLKPDILMVCELTSGEGADDILFEALNEDGVSHYDMADFVEGPGSQNELYFNSNKLGLIEQNEIETVLRDINEYVLYYKSDDIATTEDTTFFYVYVCHLKASEDFSAQRNVEVTALKDYLDTRPNAENILVGGDFNFYGSDVEPAWNTLLSGGEVVLVDPIIAAGDWHTNPGFAWLHTQSTRTSSFDSGAFGGMDDRFDFIFVSQDLRTDGNPARYIEGSYRAVGQDGLHYNDALIDPPTNTSEPWSVISNLYHMSDHLPIYLELQVVKEGASLSTVPQFRFDARYDFFNDQLVINLNGQDLDKKVISFGIYALTGELLKTIELTNEVNYISTENLNAGLYILKSLNTSFNYKFVKPKA